MIKTWRRQWQTWRQGWLDRRIPPAEEYRLSHKNLFILPTKTGWIYIALTIAIYLLGSNYENNLVRGLAYLLMSLFVVSIHHCHANVSGLRLKGQPPVSSYADNPAAFPVLIHSDKARYDLQLSAEGAIADSASIIEQQQTLQVIFTHPKRGWCVPSRLKISSQWPLGLLNCWTELDFEQRTVVYPSPQICDLDLLALDTEGENQFVFSQNSTQGQDEIQGIRPYREGESLSLIAWKQVAQGRGWVSKDFVTPIPAQCWLDLAQTQGDDLEEKLSRLCYQIESLEKQQSRYGLSIGHQHIRPNSGAAHRQHCLTALALYE